MCWLTTQPSRKAAATTAPTFASRGSRSLDLSVNEFAVLEALLRASPGFLTAEDLLDQAWDENADPFTNAVFVTISRLRRKLGDPPVIETRTRAGYHITDSCR